MNIRRVILAVLMTGAAASVAGCGTTMEQRAASGAAAGLLIGGPVGAAVGAAVGVVVDTVDEK
jgi:hypothetical protein